MSKVSDHMADAIKFLPINTTRDLERAVEFRRAGFIAAFGDANDFDVADGNGAHQYRELMLRRCDIQPLMHVHMWKNEQIIGQIEAHPLTKNPLVGYVNFYFLLPEFRGTGLGQLLDEYMTEVFNNVGCTIMQLRATPSNQRALKYYQKLGYTVEKDPEAPETMLLLTKPL